MTPHSRFLSSVVLVFISLWCAGAATAQHYQPFVDPCEFDWDFQLFKPELCDTCDVAPPSVGWFFTYDRLYWNVTRPIASGSPWDGDFTWGNRMDIGYMTEEDTGWLFGALHLDGPQEDDVNRANLSGVELNKTWRLPRFHNGAVLEPLLGVRYLKFEDYTSPSNPTENNILGGQFGGRYFNRRGRWLLSSELRFFLAENFQFLTGEDEHEFVPAGELRLQAAFNFTNKVALRVGWDLLYLGKGIARANPVATGINDEDVTVTGVGFGFTVNR